MGRAVQLQHERRIDELLAENAALRRQLLGCGAAAEQDMQTQTSETKCVSLAIPSFPCYAGSETATTNDGCSECADGLSEASLDCAMDWDADSSSAKRAATESSSSVGVQCALHIDG